MMDEGNSMSRFGWFCCTVFSWLNDRFPGGWKPELMLPLNMRMAYAGWAMTRLITSFGYDVVGGDIVAPHDPVRLKKLNAFRAKDGRLPLCAGEAFDKY
jgi:hypothetical protein